MSADEWYTIERASKHLGVSTRTLRRWIKAGKLAARLEPGPYGRQYLVPQSSISGVQVIRDVERAERQAELAAVPQVIEAYLAERESALAREVASLRGEFQEAIQRLEIQQGVLLEMLEQLQRQLATPHDCTEAGSTEAAAR